MVPCTRRLGVMRAGLALWCIIFNSVLHRTASQIDYPEVFESLVDTPRLIYPAISSYSFCWIYGLTYFQHLQGAMCAYT